MNDAYCVVYLQSVLHEYKTVENMANTWLLIKLTPKGAVFSFSPSRTWLTRALPGYLLKVAGVSRR